MDQRRSKNIVQEKSFRFAVDIVEYAHRHQKDHINLVLTRQLLRSGTSVGANIEEAGMADGAVLANEEFGMRNGK